MTTERAPLDRFRLECLALAVGGVIMPPSTTREVKVVAFTFEQLADFADCLQAHTHRENVALVMRHWGHSRTAQAIAAAITRQAGGAPENLAGVVDDLPLETATQPGCPHCRSPFFAATKCDVCGRVFHDVSQ